MLVWDDWTWLIHGSVFNHHWPLPVGNIWFFAVKGSLCLSRSSEGFLGEGASTPGAGQMPAAATRDSRSWTICSVYRCWPATGRQRNQNCQLCGVDSWISTFFIVLVANAFFFFSPNEVEIKFWKGFVVWGETHPPLYPQENSWCTFSEAPELRKAAWKAQSIDQVHGCVLVHAGDFDFSSAFSVF